MVAGGYNFTKVWRNRLPGIYKSSMSLHKFQIGLKSILSFNIEMVNMTYSKTDLLLSLVGENSGIIYLRFSIVVITQEVNYLNMAILTNSGVSTGTTLTLQAKINTDLGDPNISTTPVYFYQWITSTNTSDPLKHTKKIELVLSYNTTLASEKLLIVDLIVGSKI